MSVKISSLNTASTINSGDDINIAGNNPLTFSDWGGGWFMQDGTYIRSLNQKSIWLGDGVLASNGGLSVGYGGTLPTAGYGIIAGRLGVGTATPAYKLDVDSGATTIAARFYSPSSTATVVYVGGSGNTEYSDLVLYSNSGTGEIFKSGTGYSSYGGTLALNIFNSNGAIAFHPNSIANAMFIATNGKVGIGTSSPEQKLHVEGTVQLGNQENLAWAYDDGNYYNYITNTYDASTGMTFRAGSWTSANNVDFSFQTHYGGAGWSTKLAIKGNGNVGIGTTNPTDKLTIVGSGSYTGISLDTSSTTGGAYYAVKQNGVSSGFFGGSGAALGDTSSDLALYAETSKNIRFYTNGSATERMRIASSGNVLIGTTTDADFKLDVNGTARVTSANNTTALTIKAGSAATFEFKGNSTSGYTSSFNINDSALYIGHDSSARALILQTASLDRLTINGAGAATFSSSVTAGSFIKSGGTAAQFLKADGSVDSSAYATTSALSGYALVGHTHDLGRYSLQAPAYIDGLTASNFRSTLFGLTSNTFNISAARWNTVPTALSGLNAYGTMMAWSGADTQGFIAVDYYFANAQIGGGNGNNINWTATLIHSGNIGSYALPISGGTISGDLTTDGWFVNSTDNYGIKNSANNSSFWSQSAGWVVNSNDTTSVRLAFYTQYTQQFSIGRASEGIYIINDQDAESSILCYQGAGYGGYLTGTWNVTNILTVAGNYARINKDYVYTSGYIEYYSSFATTPSTTTWKAGVFSTGDVEARTMFRISYANNILYGISIGEDGSITAGGNLYLNAKGFNYCHLILGGGSGLYANEWSIKSSTTGGYGISHAAIEVYNVSNSAKHSFFDSAHNFIASIESGKATFASTIITTTGDILGGSDTSDTGSLTLRGGYGTTAANAAKIQIRGFESGAATQGALMFFTNNTERFRISQTGAAVFFGSVGVTSNYISVGDYGLTTVLSSVNGYFKTNNTSSYGFWEITGAKGGYTGLLFNVTNAPHMMFNSTGSGGLYYQTGGRWVMYYDYTANCLAIGSSAIDATYRLRVAGAIYATGAIVANSDGRNKENVEVVENALEKVTNLRGVTYTKKDQDSGKREMGVIAQEVEPHVPEVVHHSKDADVYGVSYGNFAGLFIEAIKEQQVLIKELQAEIEILKNK